MPLRRREPLQPLPYFLRAWAARFLNLGVVDQVEVIVRPEHQHLAFAHADFAGAAAFAIAENLEVHVQAGSLQITRTSEVAALVENIVRSAAFLFAGDVASRYAHGPQFQS